MSTNAEHAFAVVQSVEADGLRLKFEGESEAGEKRYKCNTSEAFTAGDRVYCVKDSGTYVALCKIGNPGTGSGGGSSETVKAQVLTDSGGSDKEVRITFAGSQPYVIEPYTGSDPVPLFSVFDNNALNQYSSNRYIQFRSTDDGGLEYQAPMRGTSWIKIV